MKITATRRPDEDDRVDVTDWGIKARDEVVELVNKMVNEALEIIAKEPVYVYFNIDKHDPIELEIRLPFGPQEGDTLCWIVSLREAIEDIVECSGREDGLRLRKGLAALLDRLDTALAMDDYPKAD